MTPFEIYSAMATRLRDIPELHNNVAFPRPANVEKSPLAIVANGLPRNNAGRGILPRQDVQEWTLVPVVRVLVDTNGKAPQERELLLRLLPKIVDAFDTVANQRHINDLLTGLPDPLSSFRFVDFDEGEVQYNASQNCYALDVYFSLSFKRTAEPLAIGGTP